MPGHLPCLLQATGVCQDKSLVAGYPVLRSRGPLTQSCFPIHFKLVAS